MRAAEIPIAALDKHASHHSKIRNRMTNYTTAVSRMVCVRANIITTHEKSYEAAKHKITKLHKQHKTTSNYRRNAADILQSLRR
jgi:hypothetical protein